MYFLSFVEEAVMNPDPKYDDCIIFRIEVYNKHDVYAIDEIHCITTRREEYYKLRALFDMENVNQRQLIQIKERVEQLRL